MILKFWELNFLNTWSIKNKYNEKFEIIYKRKILDCYEFGSVRVKCMIKKKL